MCKKSEQNNDSQLKKLQKKEPGWDTPYASVFLSHFLLLIVILSLIVRLVGLNCLKERLSQSLDWMDYVSGCVCVWPLWSLQSCVLRLLTALGGQLAVEFWKVCLHRDADGASQEVDSAWRRSPLLQKQGTALLRQGERQGGKEARIFVFYQLNKSNKETKKWAQRGGRNEWRRKMVSTLNTTGT